MNDGNTGLKVYLDDERSAPPGWHLVRWPSEVIELLERGGVAEVSLDHDLGDDARGTGYDVILWIEKAVALAGFVPPVLVVHSANTAARMRMEAGIAAIQRLAIRRAEGLNSATESDVDEPEARLLKVVLPGGPNWSCREARSTSGARRG